jgi:hypothetical protein
MAVNNLNIFAGRPDQAVTGAILASPKLQQTTPSHAGDTIPTEAVDAGYVSEDGLELTVDRSTNDIKDWSGTVVKKILETFSGELKWTQLETNAQSLKNFAGESNVTVTAATSSTGTRTTVKIKADELPHKSWYFKMKDGNAKILIFVPDGQVTSTDTITFSATDAIKWPVTLSCYPDKSGNSIYIFLDDGVVSA